MAYRTAAEGTVLLRNTGVLPFAQDKKVLVTGRFLDDNPRMEGRNPLLVGRCRRLRLSFLAPGSY